MDVSGNRCNTIFDLGNCAERSFDFGVGLMHMKDSASLLRPLFLLLWKHGYWMDSVLMLR